MCPSSGPHRTGAHPHLGVYYMLNVFPGGQGPGLLHLRSSRAQPRVWHKRSQASAVLSQMSEGDISPNALACSGHLMVTQSQVSVKAGYSHFGTGTCEGSPQASGTTSNLHSGDVPDSLSPHLHIHLHQGCACVLRQARLDRI